MKFNKRFVDNSICGREKGYTYIKEILVNVDLSY